MGARVGKNGCSQDLESQMMAIPLSAALSSSVLMLPMAQSINPLNFKGVSEKAHGNPRGKLGSGVVIENLRGVSQGKKKMGGK